MLTWLRTELFEGDAPDVVTGTWIARRLDGDAGAVLLVIATAIVASALFASFVREDYARWGRVVKEAGIKLE